MHICVLNGSPKGKYSITLQTVRYLETRFADCTFDVVDVGQRIRAYEKDMTEALAQLAQADLVLFSYPVYTFLAPSQLHRFIELLKASGVDLSGKPAAQITTSKHFYDVTAQAYIKDNAQDLGMRYIGGLSADMEDLLTEKGQADAVAFWQYVLHCLENGISDPLPLKKEKASRAPYVAQRAAIEKQTGFDTVIVTDMLPQDASLAGMIADFRAVYPYNTRVINIREYPFSGGCLGCFHCAATGKCIYRDNFDTFLRDEIQTASAIVYAFTIQDHSMGAAFKRYDDRQFCNGHRTVTVGMPIGYLISGDYAQQANLRMVVEARADVGHNFLAGVATDEGDTVSAITQLSSKLCYALQNRLLLPQTFYGVGGLKIFRDLIYVMRGMMKADHKFYKAHGFYDFPQKKVGTIVKMQLVGLLIGSPAIAKKMGNRMNDGMIAPYQKVIAKAKKNGRR